MNFTEFYFIEGNDIMTNEMRFDDFYSLLERH